jgi:hypothetical protein
MHIIAPNISVPRQHLIFPLLFSNRYSHPMPLDQNRIAIRILLHRRLQTLPKILLVRRVLDNRYPQAIIVAQVALLAATFGDAFDLLDFFDFEARIRAEVALDDEGYEDGPLRVCVNAAACAAFECGEEERGAGGRFKDLVYVSKEGLMCDMLGTL